MPTLSLSIPDSTWAKLEQVRKREGVQSVRMLCIYRIAQLAQEADALKPTEEPAEAAA